LCRKIEESRNEEKGRKEERKNGRGRKRKEEARK